MCNWFNPLGIQYSLFYDFEIHSHWNFEPKDIIFLERKESLTGLNRQVKEVRSIDKCMKKKNAEWVAFADIFKQYP